MDAEQDAGPHTVGSHLDEVLAAQRAELDVMREALRRERASSDFLWDRALQRGMITEEDWAISRDPVGLERLQQARIVRQGTDQQRAIMERHTPA